MWAMNSFPPLSLCSCAEAQPDIGTTHTCSRGAPCAQVVLLSMLTHSAPRSGLLLSGWHLLCSCLPFCCCRGLLCNFCAAHLLTYRVGPQPLLTGQMQQQASSAASLTRRPPCQRPTAAAAAQRECQLLPLQSCLHMPSLSAPACFGSVVKQRRHQCLHCAANMADWLLSAHVQHACVVICFGSCTCQLMHEHWLHQYVPCCASCG